MSDFWKLILESNTFNFIVLIAIFWVIAIKVNLPEIFETIRLNVAASIENAKLDLKNAQNSLKQAKKEAKNATVEAEEKIKLAKENAEGLSKDILNNAKIQVSKIESNVLRVVESEERKISAKLTNETLLSAVALAKRKLVERLSSDKELQNKLVSDCINELDEIEL